MSDAQNQGEPTMEEILASIRKIISEDGTPGEGEEAPQDGEPAEAAEAEPEPEDQAGDEDDDVLNLTQMVGEDGGVVDLDESAEAEPESPAEEVAVEVEPAPEPEPGPDETMAALAPEQAAAEESAAPELVAVEDEPEPVLPAPELDEANLVSEATRAAATASIAGLAMSAVPATGGASTPLTDSKSLEDLVRELMRPYLKSWLDQHLAGLVERIVRDEIQKMVKRAEYR